MTRLIALRLAVAAVIIGAAAVAAGWLVTYRDVHPWVGPAVVAARTTFTSPAWTTPHAALIGIAAVGVATLVLGRR